MKKLLFLISFLLSTSIGLKAQTEIIIDTLIFSGHWFDDLEKAKQNPEEVYYLDLSLQKLKSFPNEILEFPNLKKLLIPVNYWPSMPDAISKLTQLEELDISSNYYMSTLPSGLAKLKNLKKITLRDNRLKAGEIEKLKKWLPEAEIITD